jgi:hypothetical protein
LAIELPSADGETFKRRLAEAIREYAPAFEGYRITEAPDRALRELLATCRLEGIEPALFLMPEEKRFLAAYSSQARFDIDRYLTALHADYGCPVFDATHWCEAKDFSDGHHLLARGAQDFSRRFGAYALARSGPPSLPGGRRPAESAADMARRDETHPVPQFR